MGIRAKMVCTGCSDDQCGNEQLRMEPVYEGSEENKQWSQWTPGGSLHLSISNPTAKGKHEVGKEYYVDITEVESCT